jgi:hypothetical protein
VIGGHELGDVDGLNIAVSRGVKSPDQSFRQPEHA